MGFKKCVLKSFSCQVCKPLLGTVVLSSIQHPKLPQGLSYFMSPNEMTSDVAKQYLASASQTGFGIDLVTTADQFVMKGVLGEYSVVSLAELQVFYLMEDGSCIRNVDLSNKMLKDTTIPWFRVKSNPAAKTAMSAIYFQAPYTGYSTRFEHNYKDAANLIRGYGSFRISTDDGLSIWCEPAELFKAKYNNRGWAEELKLVPTIKPIDIKIPNVASSVQWAKGLAAQLLPDLYRSPDVGEYTVKSDESTFEFLSDTFKLRWKRGTNIMEIHCPAYGSQTPISLRIKHPFKTEPTDKDIQIITSKFKKAMNQVFSCAEGLLTLQRNIQGIYKYNITVAYPIMTKDEIGFEYRGAAITMKPKDWEPEVLVPSGSRCAMLLLKVNLSGKLIACKSQNLISNGSGVVEHSHLIGRTLDELGSMKPEVLKGLMEAGTPK